MVIGLIVASIALTIATPWFSTPEDRMHLPKAEASESAH